MTKTLPAWIRDALLACAGAVAFYALVRTEHVFWYLPAGARFATLLLLPYRSWLWFLASVELLFIHEASWAGSVATFEIYGLALFTAGCIGPWLLRRNEWSAQPMTFAAMAQLVAAMALSSVATALVNPYAYTFTAAAQMSLLRLRLQMVLGDYIGILVLVPFALMILRARPDAATLRRWRFDVPVVLLPTLLLYAVLDAEAAESQVFFFSALLAFVPSIYFAVRSGWRGAALALTGISVVVAWSEFLTGNADLTVEAQGVLAVAGSATLLLGAARDALIDNQRELLERNAGLLAANERQDRLAGELRDAARRNLDMAEELRRGITSELHDEIGQNLAALQTRVRLLERLAGAEGSELASDIATTLMRMRQTVSGLMSSLRPAGLDDFGLAIALHEGAIRGTLEAAGLVYDLHIDAADDCLDHLDSNAQTALYRIVQEFATNTIRHAHATRLSVRLRARGAANGIRILLAIADDGRGFDLSQRAAGIGLLGIRDRVLAMGGRLRLRSGTSGTRLCMRGRFPVHLEIFL